MAHELAIANGRYSLAYAGKPPWHGLGTQLDAPFTAAEAIEFGGLDYDVALTPLLTESGSHVSSRRAVVRADTSEVLGVVGTSYVPIQNAACFGFLDAVVAEGKLRYHTVGALRNGERIWMLAKLPGQLRVSGTDDVTEKYLLLSNSHDGSSALRVFFTPVRVVCANTLAIATRRGMHQGIAIHHKGDLATKVREAQRVLGLAQRFYDDANGVINQLARYQPSVTQLQNYFRALYPGSAEGVVTRAQNIRCELTRLFEEGRGQEIHGIRHSAWAALNAVTEYVDHHRPTRGVNSVARNHRRLNSIWFGSGARLKSQAWDLAVAMLAG
jgi:phage/plasmid-like protein (TIGR03299 family)